MSNAAWRPSQGSWGVFGTDPDSNLGRIRHIAEKLPDRKFTEKVPHAAGVPLDIAGKPIEGLGPWHYRGEGKMHGTSLGEFSDLTPENLKSSWYRTLRKQAIETPLLERAGTGEGGRFAPYEPFEVEGLGDLAAGYTGTKILPKDMDIGYDVEQLGKGLETAEGIYKEGEEIYETSLEEAEKEFGREKKAISRARVETSRAGGEEVLASEAAQAATGMEYSAPATRATEVEAPKTMASISVKEEESRLKKEETIAAAEKEMYGAEGVEAAWTGAQESYKTALKDLYGGVISEGLPSIKEEMDVLMGSRQYLAPATGAGGKDVSGIAGMFTETAGDVPGYTDLSQSLYAAEEFATFMKQQAKDIDFTLGTLSEGV